MVARSVDYGVTYDELPRQTYGEWIWQLYRGHRALESFAPDVAGKNAHLYGGLFDVTAVALQRVLPLDRFVVRHGLNAAVGWIGIVACGLLATRLAGRTAGLLAMVLLALTPRYLGEAMNNPKDIPLAAWWTATLAVLAAIPPRYPYLTTRRTVALGVAAGLAIGVRAAALLLLAYAAAVAAIQMIRAGERAPRRVAATLGLLLVAAVIATTAPIPVWPWLMMHPYSGLLDALMPAAPVDAGRPMLFAGGVVTSARLPWTYVPVWFLVTTPIVVLAGAALSTIWLVRPSPRRVAAWGLVAAIAVPVLGVVITGAALYDGVRHLLFVRPMLAALAAVGWMAVLQSRTRGVRAAGLVALVLGLAEPLAFTVASHPHQAVYFSPLVGGPRGAEGRYELDSWGNCLFRAQQHVAALAREAGMPVIVDGSQWRMIGLNAARIPGLVVDESGDRRHNVEVRLLHGTPDEIREHAARGDRLASITTADGAVLCTVVPGPAFPALAERIRP